MLPNAFIYNLFLLFSFLHHLLQAMPKEANSVKKLQFVTTAQEYQLYLQQ